MELHPDSYEEERREVLDSLLEALCRQTPDPDEMAACAFLVRHLSGEACLLPFHSIQQHR